VATTIYLVEFLGGGPLLDGDPRFATVYPETDPIGELVYPWPYPCPAPPTPDPDPPVVTFVAPTPGTTLQPGGTITVDVTDPGSGLRLTFLAIIESGTELVELVHDGSSFMPRYVGHSYRTAITDGFRYFLRRAGGWPAGMVLTLRVWSVDKSGNMV
jgi:hypothetical protein